MNAEPLKRRIEKLEETARSATNERGQSPVDVLRERRDRLYRDAGITYQERICDCRAHKEKGEPLSFLDIIQMPACADCQAHWRVQSEALEAAIKKQTVQSK